MLALEPATQVDRTLKVLKFLQWFSNDALQCLSNSKGDIVNPLSTKSFLNSMDAFLNLKEELKLMQFELGRLIFADDIGLQMTKTQSILPLLSAPTFGSFVGACFSSSSAKQDMLMGKALGDNYCDIIANLRNITNHPVASNLGKLATYLRYKDIQRKDVFIDTPSTFKYKLEGTNVILEKHEQSVMRQIRGKLLCAEDTVPNPGNLIKDIVLYIHGGAFVLCSPENSEPVLVEFSRQLGSKVALLVVDYRLAPENRFPAGLQDVLDTFLWFKNSKDQLTEEVLGFKVGKIIVAGESAGSCLAASMICSLSDAKRKWPKNNFFMPDGFLSIVGLFSSKFESYPSTLLSALDPLFNPWQKMLIVFGGYSPFEPELDKYHSGKEVLKSQNLKKFLEVSSHPYMSPLFYDVFDSLKDLPLSLITSTTCPIADHSVIMAKKWHGPVKLIALDRLPHVFFMFGSTESGRKGIQSCIDEIKRLFNCS